MTRITRHALAIAVALLASFLSVSNSVAQCTSSNECKMPLTCHPGFFGGYCAFQYCNVDGDCRRGSVCDFGTCQTTCRHNTDCDAGEVCVRGASDRLICLPPSPSPPPPPSGDTTRYYTEGGVCGTIRLGGPLSTHVKHLGCAPGLQCVRVTPDGIGTCQRSPS